MIHVIISSFMSGAMLVCSFYAAKDREYFYAVLLAFLSIGNGYMAFLRGGLA